MKIEDIIELWEKDSTIDKTELADESLIIPKLHNKYYRILIEERMTLKSLESKMKQLRLLKYEFYTQGPNDLSREKGWTIPPKGLILKSDIPMYMDGDKDMIDMVLRIDLQKEKIDFLESIIKSVMNRNFIIKSAIEWIKFSMGG